MADKGILPKNKELYSGKRICDNEIVYGMAVIPIDESKALLVDRVEENTMTDGAPCLCYYVAVVPDSVTNITEDLED